MTAPETTLYNLVGWMLTYGLHSSVCFGLAWVCVILLRLNRPRARLAVWRTALLGPVLSATLHTTGLVGPVFDGLTIAAPARTFPTTVASAIVSPLPASPSRTEPSGFAGPADLPGSATPRPPIWIVALIGVWTVGAGTGLLRWFVGRRRLLSLISDRRPIRCGELLHRLAARMNVRQRVRVSMCDQAPVPFAFGIRSPEICLPAPLTGELTCRASQALLAHELAHVAGRDPAWQLVYWLVESTLFFQPLNRIMRRQLEHEAELLADERAASCTGRSIDLARCLVTVAERLAAAEGPQPMPAALGRATGLEERVQRLLSNPAGDRQLSRSAVALALGTVAVVIFLTPNISFIWAASARPDLPQMTRPPQPIYPGEGAIAVPTEPEPPIPPDAAPVSYTHLRAHET